jgi:hypothetical protein
VTPEQQAHTIVQAGPFVALWILFYLLAFLSLPFVFFYVPWRVLRDLRRIANGIELLAGVRQTHTEPAPLPRRASNPIPQESIVPSAFGR